MTSAASLTVRPATPEERVDVLSVLDAAMLETDAGALADRIAADSVLVAVAEERVLGAVEVREEPPGGHIEAVAVRRNRRGQGIGTRLLQRAYERWQPLSATFDLAVAPFYEKQGFDVRQVLPERGHGVKR